MLGLISLAKDALNILVDTTVATTKALADHTPSLVGSAALLRKEVMDAIVESQIGESFERYSMASADLAAQYKSTLRSLKAVFRGEDDDRANGAAEEQDEDAPMLRS